MVPHLPYFIRSLAYVQFMLTAGAEFSIPVQRGKTSGLQSPALLKRKRFVFTVLLMLFAPICRCHEDVVPVAVEEIREPLNCPTDEIKAGKEKQPAKVELLKFQPHQISLFKNTQSV